MSFYYSRCKRHKPGQKLVTLVESCETGARDRCSHDLTIYLCAPAASPSPTIFVPLRHDWRRRTREIVQFYNLELTL